MLERFQPSCTRLLGLFISIAQLSSLPLEFGTSTRKDACGLVQLNSVTVPLMVMTFSPSNIAPEWCTNAGAEKAVMTAANAPVTSVLMVWLPARVPIMSVLRQHGCAKGAA